MRPRVPGARLQRKEVPELHYIAPMTNLESVASLGLLSHDRAAVVPHQSVASESVQSNRVGKRIPGGGLLHSYVNTYFHARNSMMFFLLANGKAPLIVFRVSHEVLDLPNVIISDGNAATGTTRFFPSPDGLNHLDSELVFAISWNHQDPFVKAERKRVRSAEVLVPDLVLPESIIGCYTLTESDATHCRGVNPSWKVEVKKSVYFQ